MSLNSQKTVDPAVDKKSAGEATLTGGNITIEGCLNCKAAVAEGKVRQLMIQEVVTVCLGDGSKMVCLRNIGSRMVYLNNLWFSCGLCDNFFIQL